MNDEVVAFQQGAQQGADEQLHLCVDWIRRKHGNPALADCLQEAMRPTTPISKREQALKLLDNAIRKSEALHLMGDDIALFHEALMEGQGDG